MIEPIILPLMVLMQLKDDIRYDEVRQQLIINELGISIAMKMEIRPILTMVIPREIF